LLNLRLMSLVWFVIQRSSRSRQKGGSAKRQNNQRCAFDIYQESSTGYALLLPASALLFVLAKALARPCFDCYRRLNPQRISLSVWPNWILARPQIAHSPRQTAGSTHPESASSDADGPRCALAVEGLICLRARLVE